jgi:ribosomal protein L40E
VNYLGGHKLRPYFGIICASNIAHMICRNCCAVNPEPGSECDDGEED